MIAKAELNTQNKVNKHIIHDCSTELQCQLHFENLVV